MPSRAQNDAIILPCHVSGTISPYPTVHSVICRDERYGRVEPTRRRACVVGETRERERVRKKTSKETMIRKWKLCVFRLFLIRPTDPSARMRNGGGREIFILLHKLKVSVLKGIRAYLGEGAARGEYIFTSNSWGLTTASPHTHTHTHAPAVQ